MWQWRVATLGLILILIIFSFVSSYNYLNWLCKKKKLLNEHLNNPLARIAVIRVKIFIIDSSHTLANFFNFPLWMTMKKREKNSFISLSALTSTISARRRKKNKNKNTTTDDRQKKNGKHLNWIYIFVSLLWGERKIRNTFMSE